MTFSLFVVLLNCIALYYVVFFKYRVHPIYINEGWVDLILERTSQCNAIQSTASQASKMTIELYQHLIV